MAQNALTDAGLDPLARLESSWTKSVFVTALSNRSRAIPAPPAALSNSPDYPGSARELGPTQAWQAQFRGQNPSKTTCLARSSRPALGTESPS